MDQVMLVNLVLLSALSAAGAVIILRSRRGAEEVLADLRQDLLVQQRGGNAGNAGELPARNAASRRNRSKLHERLLPVAAAAVAAAARLLTGGSLSSLVAFTVAAAAIAYLYAQGRARARRATYLRNIEFYLPIVMERIVMAVQAGLDVIPAIQAVVELDRPPRGDGQESATEFADPVSALLWRVQRLTEAGVGFEQSLREVAASVECSALRHAFIHLAVAQKEGGELILPLKELSDSTQLYYQETVEEEIAKLPVKATLPLLLTFAGLIVFFVTSPLIQILNMTSKAMVR